MECWVLFMAYASSTAILVGVHGCFFPTQQVEERLRFYEEGLAPRKNSNVMDEAMTALKVQLTTEDKKDGTEKKKKKDKVGLRNGLVGRAWVGRSSSWPTPHYFKFNMVSLRKAISACC